jgi:hypothetical protein
MIPPALRSNRSRLAITAQAAAPLAIAALTALLLHRYPPDQYSFYPRCPILFYLHLQCPGCGTTRALAALLHGHLRDALRLNALTTLLLPIAILYSARYYPRLVHQGLANWPQPDSRVVYATLTVAILFTIVRNLSF